MGVGVIICYRTFKPAILFNLGGACFTQRDGDKRSLLILLKPYELGYKA